MHAFDILGDPVRRGIPELIARGERSARSLTEVIQKEFAITQAAVSQHLRTLRESGFVQKRGASTPSTRNLCSKSTPGSRSSVLSGTSLFALSPAAKPNINERNDRDYLRSAGQEAPPVFFSVTFKRGGVMRVVRITISTKDE